MLRAVFIRGNGIRNAREYELLNKKTDGTYEHMMTTTALEEGGEALRGFGFISDDFTPKYDEESEYAIISAPIRVDNLMDFVGEGTCVKGLEEIPYYSAVFANVENPLDVINLGRIDYKKGLRYDELMAVGTSAENIRNYAESVGANCIWFVSRGHKGIVWPVKVRRVYDIEFGFTFGNGLNNGQTYNFVVRAIGEGGKDLDGDGVIYADSDYSLPVEYQKGVTIWYVDNRANIEKVKTDANIAGRGWSLIASNPAYNAIIGRPINTWGFFTNKANQNLTIMKLASKGATTGEVIATVTATPVDGFAVVKFPTVTLKDGEYLSIGSDANEDIHMYYTTTSITDANGLVDIGFHSRVPKVYGTGSAWTEYISGTFAWSFGYTSD